MGKSVQRKLVSLEMSSFSLVGDSFFFFACKAGVFRNGVLCDFHLCFAHLVRVYLSRTHRSRFYDALLISFSCKRWVFRLFYGIFNGNMKKVSSFIRGLFKKARDAIKRIPLSLTDVRVCSPALISCIDVSVAHIQVYSIVGLYWYQFGKFN